MHGQDAKALMSLNRRIIKTQKQYQQAGKKG